MDLSEILRILASFHEHQVDYILIGGVAINLHGLGRPTEDIDFFVRPTGENVARIRNALKAVYQDESLDEITAEDLSGEYPTVRYGPPHGAFFIDLISRLGDFAAYDDLHFEESTFRGVPVRLATPQTLYWLKKGTLRLRDRADAEALRERFHLEDRDTP
jgi:hypothetical protein